jgi:hypothetical protein
MIRWGNIMKYLAVTRYVFSGLLNLFTVISVSWNQTYVNFHIIFKSLGTAGAAQCMFRWRLGDRKVMVRFLATAGISLYTTLTRPPQRATQFSAQ